MNLYSQITPEILELSALFESNCKIDPALYDKYDVKRGLRDLNGKGVLTGLTAISDIVSSKIIDGEEHHCEGKLYYCLGTCLMQSSLTISPRFLPNTVPCRRALYGILL